MAFTRGVVSPYRICPLGAHVDHQGGRMLATAVDLGTRLDFEPDRKVELESANYDGVVRFDPAAVGSAPPADLPGWGRFVWAAFAVLRDRLPGAPSGFRGRIQGALPGAGLSSSASVMLAYLSAWADANELVLDARELVQLAVEAENAHVGVACGVLDPAAILGSRAGALLEIDADRIAWEATPLGATASPARFLVCFTGRERSLAATPFNARVTDCGEAATWVARRLGVAPVGRLGDLDREALRECLDEIPGPGARRARHFVEECDRVAQGRRAWRDGDLATFGALMRSSCRSSIEQFEVGSEELVALQAIWESTEGVLGARFSGGGFGGCSLALVEAERVAAVKAEVGERFGRAFPALAARMRVVEVESANGLSLRGGRDAWA
jgi:galactokinase/galacturonokinase